MGTDITFANFFLTNQQNSCSSLSVLTQYQNILQDSWLNGKSVVTSWSFWRSSVRFL